MKLLTIRRNGGYHPAVLIGDDVLDLTIAKRYISAAALIPDSTKVIIAGGNEALALIQKTIDGVPSVAAQLKSDNGLIAYDEADLGPVIPNPQILLAASMNSYAHVKEMGDEPPKYPCGFHKAVSSICASGDDILLPTDHGEHVDWEGEFSIVISKRCHKVTPEEAGDYIAGYTMVNDVSAREFAKEFKASGPDVGDVCQAWERNVLGKSYPTFSPMGPVMATKDEMPWPLTYRMQTIVNGEVMQDSTQEDLVFSPGEVISYFSQVIVFEAGDVITMGSPPGVGMARKPPIYLKPGDQVDIHVDGIGTLKNGVAKTT